jgi:hypothetical protein
MNSNERMSKKKKEEVYMCFKGGLFLEAFPIKPLKPNLQNLTRSMHIRR